MQAITQTMETIQGETRYSNTGEISYVNLKDTAKPGIYNLVINIHFDLTAIIKPLCEVNLMEVQDIVNHLKDLGIDKTEVTILTVNQFNYPLKPESISQMVRITATAHINRAVFADKYRAQYININKNSGIYNDGAINITDKVLPKYQFPAGSYLKLIADVWDGKEYSPEEILLKADIGGEIISSETTISKEKVMHIIFIKPYTECLSLIDAQDGIN